ncbi:hypothetical protein [Frankia tisae]|uniref:hypothetical protein n=1 Tax=Frankia tisae TaxID=2950104 RepID=UPI0021C00503|nr:hypothetical protein [Frankia tisae]
MVMSRGRRQALFPPGAQTEPGLAAAEAAAVEAGGEELPPLVFALSFPDGPGCNVDLSGVACPRLVRSLAAALRRQAQVGGRIRTRSTAYIYMAALRRLDEFLATRVAHPARMPLAELTAQLLDDFECHLYQRVPERRTAYGLVLNVVALLRHVRDTEPELLHDSMPARLRFIGVGAYPHPGQGVDAYPLRVAAALRQACREQIRMAVHRITVEGEAVLARGRDPRLHGWDDEANLLWEINRRGVLTVADLAAAAGWSRKQAGRWGIRRLHQLLYPDETDLAALAILFALDTGLEPESLRELAVDCRKNPARGYVEVDYLKRRRRGQEWNRLRVRDGNASTPGGLLRLVVRLTRRARQHVGDDAAALWVGYQAQQNLLARSRLMVHDRSGAAALARRHGLAGEDGEPLVVDFRRLRKTHKAEFYRATGGQLPLLARGHSREVAAARYADIPALRDTHESAVSDGLAEALADAVQLRVLSTADERRLAEQPTLAPQVAGIEPEQVAPLLAGELDLWLSACRDFANSPFGSPGKPCPVPFWSCLDCSNAIITSRKLPAVLAFLDHVEEQREHLDAEAWAGLHGATRRRILTQILPAFPDDLIAQARAIAEADRPLEHLPPLLGGIGTRA